MEKYTNTVILIDDDLEDGYLIDRAIAETGWNIDFNHYTSGVEFLSYMSESLKVGSEWLYRNKVMLFIDIRMPGDDGFTILKSIRADEQMTCIPICMLTTSKSHTDIRRAYRLGANCYLSKSNNFEETKDQISRTLDFWFRKAMVLPLRNAA